MKIRLSFFLASLVLFQCASLFAEDDFPYALSPVKEGAWIGGSLGMYGASILLDGKKASPDPAEVDASKIPFFDRLYVDKQSTALGTTTDILVIGFAALPAIALPGLDWGEKATVGVMYGESLALSYSLCALLKSMVVRYRPYAYSASPSDISGADIVSSFPSRHSALAFTTAVFAGTVFDELNPDSRYRGLVWAGGLGAATAIAALRVASGDHFISDVAAGAALGALVGYAVPRLHKARASARSADESSVSLDLSPEALLVRVELDPR